MKYKSLNISKDTSPGCRIPVSSSQPTVGIMSGAARRWLMTGAVCALATTLLPATAEAKKPVTAQFDLGTATLEDVQQAMDSGALTSVQLVNLYLRRIAVYDQNGAPFLNSVMFVNPDVIEEARASDELRAQGKKIGPLHGIPCFVKGSYSVKGLPTSAGMTGWANLIAPEDCYLVNKLREGGAVIMGQANMDTFANSGTSSTSQIKGAVKNAYVLGTTAGGSSGGSAVSTAAYFSFFAFGGETGASIRGPSDRAGICGQRPTAGGMPSNHIVNLSAERDVVGPMARHIADIGYIRDTVAFQDPQDPWAPILPLFYDGRPFPKGFSAAKSGATLAGKKLGIIGTYVGMTHPNPGEGATTNTTAVTTTRPEIFANLEASKAQMEAAGATVSYVFLPPDVSTTYDRGLSAPQRLLSNAPYSTRFNAHAHRGMLEFLLKKPGDTIDTLAAKVVATAPLATSNTLTRAINDTTISFMYTYGSGGEVTGYGDLTMDSPEATEHYTALREIRRKLEAWMDSEGLDALVFPVDSGKMPTGGSVNGRDPINAMHIPGTVVPNGSLPDGEPTCLIFVGKGAEDVKVFQLAYAFEQVSKKRYSTPLAPPLPDESFTYTVKPLSKKSPTTAPVLTVSSKAALQGSGSEATYSIGGTLIHKSPLSQITVYVNGQRVPSSYSEDGTNKWSSVISVSDVIAAAGSAKKVQITVEATDIYGLTDVETTKLKISNKKLKM